MIWNWILYLGAYLTISLIIFYLIFESVTYLGKKIFNKDLVESGPSNNFDLVLRIIGVIVTPLIMTYYIFLSLNYSPPLNLAASGELFESKEIMELDNEISSITETLENVDDLTLKQIREELSRVLKLFKKLKQEASHQQETITRLKKIASEEKRKAEETKEYAETLNSISKEQIEAIGSMITSDSKIQNEKSFWIGVGISLPIGIIASLLASFFWDWRRKNTDTNN